MNFIAEIKQEIKNKINSALEGLQKKGELPPLEIPDYVLEVPREANHGDFAANVAMLLARQARMAPRKIAELIVAEIELPPLLVERVEVAGAGFINFYLKNDWLFKVPAEILRLGKDYGRELKKNNHKIQVEFVSANPTGDLHMGNARGGAIGDSLANILDAAGNIVEKEYYINDAGNQIDLFAASLEARYLELLELPFEFPEGGYAGHDVVETAVEALAEFDHDLVDLSVSDRRDKLVRFALKNRVDYINKTLRRFGIEYDVWFNESSLHSSGEVMRVIDDLESKGYIYEKEGAKWFKTTLFGDEKDEVVIRNNGVPTYFAADIAYHKNKFERGFDTVINIWGADHHGHVARMKGAIEALDYNSEALEVILMQLVRLYRDGEIVRMSKRTGTLVTLDELLDEVGKDAARFSFVMRSPDSHLEFDMDLARKESQENPVYYAQYAHARICSILRQAESQGIEFPDVETVDFSVLKEEEELALLRSLADFPEEIQIAARTRAPQRIPHYITELAGLLHGFYFHHRVLNVEPEFRDSRLALMKAVGITLANALALIGVSAPERM
ncbi:MAG: arginine--tRNA ligase [Chitinophagales bacterium]